MIMDDGDSYNSVVYIFILSNFVKNKICCNINTY